MIKFAHGRTKTPKHYICFDSETELIHSYDKKYIYHNLYMIFSYYSVTNKLIEYSGHIRFCPENFLDYFWYDLFKYIMKYRDVYIFAHNMKYDFITCNMYNFLGKYFPEKGKFNFSIDRPFFIIFQHEDISIKFIDTTNYFFTSLEKLSKLIGKVQKKKYNSFYSHNYHKCREYCRDDVLALKNIVEYLFKMCHTEKTGKIFPLSLASLSYNVFTKNFLTTKCINKSTESKIEMERSSYYGGRVEMYQKGKLSNVYYVDVNSLFPFLMKNCFIPYRYSDKKTNYGIYKVKVKTKVNRYPYRDENGLLVFPVGEFITYLHEPELTNECEILDVQYYKTINLFEQFVEHYYSKRLLSKDPALKYFYKILMNSLYGKFAQKNFDINQISECEFSDLNSYWINDKYTINLFGMIYQEIENMISDCTACYISGSITSYARNFMWKFLEKLTVYYMDTDSLMINKSSYEWLKKNGWVDNEKIGKFKLEGIFEAEFFGLKDYRLDDIVKMKGVSKNFTRIRDGLYKGYIFPGFKYFIKKGSLSEYENVLMIKELSRNYKKGKIGVEGKVKPIILNAD